MCIRDRGYAAVADRILFDARAPREATRPGGLGAVFDWHVPVSYTHLRAHETVLDLVCRLLLETKKQYVIPYSLCSL